MTAFSLFHHTGRELGDEVRLVMRAEGATDLELPACKAWVRRLIHPIAPVWHLGIALTPHQAQVLGERFDYMLQRARRRLKA